MLRNISVHISLIGLSLITTSCGTIAPAPAPTSAHLTPQAETPAAQLTPQAESPPEIVPKSVPSATQRSQQQTIADYFLAIPSQYLQLSQLGSSRRQSASSF